MHFLTQRRRLGTFAHVDTVKAMVTPSRIMKDVLTCHGRLRHDEKDNPIRFIDKRTLPRGFRPAGDALVYKLGNGLRAF